MRDAKEQMDYLDVAGLNRAVEDFLAHGVWPGPAWGRVPGEVVTPADLPKFHETVRAMAAAAAA